MRGSGNEYTAVHRSPNKLWRSNSKFNLWDYRTTTNANAKKSKKEITLYRIKIVILLKRTDTFFEELYITKVKKVAMEGYYFSTIKCKSNCEFIISVEIFYLKC